MIAPRQYSLAVDECFTPSEPQVLNAIRAALGSETLDAG
jgi:hypothetical protein